MAYLRLQHEQAAGKSMDARRRERLCSQLSFVTSASSGFKLHFLAILGYLWMGQRGTKSASKLKKIETQICCGYFFLFVFPFATLFALLAQPTLRRGSRGLHYLLPQRRASGWDRITRLFVERRQSYLLRGSRIGGLIGMPRNKQKETKYTYDDLICSSPR